MSFIDIMRKIGSDWTNMSDEGKRPYKERNEADKVRFAEEALTFERKRSGHKAENRQVGVT